MKRRIKTIFLLLLSAALLVSLAGCGEMKIQDNERIRPGVDAVLTALLAGDEEAGYAAVYHEISRKEFVTAFAQMRELLAEVETYELTPIQYNFRSTNGTRAEQMVYRMTTNAGTYVVSAVVVEGYQGLTSFHIAPEENTALSYTGTPGHMEGASLGQWIVLILGLLGWAFVIWMAVDCCRRKIRRKWLWLIVILLGGVLLTLSASATSMNFRFNVGLHLRLSSWIFYGDGTSQLQLLVPVGALVYLLRRKKLKNSEEPEDHREKPEENPVFQTESD